MAELDRLLSGISIYQDVVVAGKTERKGVRDCESRWQAIAPYLPARGALLDVGANFGWFCLRWCAEGAERTAVAWEADLRTAAVARYVLASHRHERVCLATTTAEAEAVRKMEAAGQRFDAVLCLSVLHWIADHREFVATLGRIADRIFIEHCDPREEGAGIEQLRREIGDIGPYLRNLFPELHVERIAVWEGHRSKEYPRELWLVARNENKPTSAEASRAGSSTNGGIFAGAVLPLSVVWPPRSWWRERLDETLLEADGRTVFTPHGIRCRVEEEVDAKGAVVDDPDEIRSAIANMPERGVTTLRRRLARWLHAARRRLTR
ncbi:MAG: class I SAM-dependent methyltransferase [Planctomycetia bacterium]|nr:class I SAM-dependent methyltransferase [Planctomycetia bacterium]